MSHVNKKKTTDGGGGGGGGGGDKRGPSGQCLSLVEVPLSALTHVLSFLTPKHEPYIYRHEGSPDARYVYLKA